MPIGAPSSEGRHRGVRIHAGQPLVCYPFHHARTERVPAAIGQPVDVAGPRPETADLRAAWQ
jgi:hypothetical protein